MMHCLAYSLVTVVMQVGRHTGRHTSRHAGMADQNSSFGAFKIQPFVSIFLLMACLLEIILKLYHLIKLYSL